MKGIYTVKVTKKDIADMQKQLKAAMNPYLKIGGQEPHCSCDCHPENNSRMLSRSTVFFDKETGEEFKFRDMKRIYF